jgi:serine/threonine-protein kinase
MAQVWAARPPGTRGFRKLVALKTLHNGASDMRLEDMLLEEAKLASQIVHPNVVATHELGEDEGILYLVMEWVDGLPLSDIIKAENARQIPIPIAVQIFAQVCRGLHAAHELRDESDQPLGLVHRDISPQNILIERKGIAKIVDFGVAKATARDSGLTEDGELKGKIAYMAPEQISGEKVDRRTDIFALGSVFYLLTTGRHPFRGQTVAETVRNICAGTKPESPSQFSAGFPPELERIIIKALSPKPAGRYATTRDLLADLEASFPEWTQTRSEQAVAEYLEQTVGARLRSRREQLKRAHNEMDAGDPRSGTMRALTLESVAGHEANVASSSGLVQQESASFVAPSRAFPLRTIVA